MLDFANQRGSTAGPIRPIWGSTFAARPPVWVRAMHELADQTAGTGATGFDSAALSMIAKAMQANAGNLAAELVGSLAGRRSKPSLRASLILDLRLYLPFPSPSQNLNLRTFPIWLCGAENDLRTWPLSARSREHLRSRKGTCRTPAGRLFGPIGRLFRPSGHGLFGVALAAPDPCVGQALVSNDRQAMEWPAIDNVTVRIQLGTPQTRKRTFVDICAERSYPGAMERPHTALRLSLRPCLRPSLRRWLRCSIEPEAGNRRPRRGLRAWRRADISTQPPHRNIRLVRGAAVVLAISPIAFALGAFAIASALAPQRFAVSTAPIALGATPIASALARQRLVAERPRAWRLA
jgi:hypothetical protein